MVRVVNLGDEIRDRELQPVGEDAARFVLRRKAELGAEILEDVGDMRDDDGAVAQERGANGVCGAPPSSIAIIAFMPRPAPRSLATST